MNMDRNSVHFMSKTPEWATPQSLFDELDREFHFTLDPAATKENAKCKKFYTSKENGLDQTWSGECVFLNPPYGRVIGKWVEKAAMGGGVKSPLASYQPGQTLDGSMISSTGRRRSDSSEAV